MVEYGLLIFGVLIGYIGLAWFLKKRNDSKLIAKENVRDSQDHAAFLNYFVQKGFPDELVSALYKEVSLYVPEKKFKMHPEDDLIKDYAIDDGDLEDLAVKLFELKNSRKPRLFEIEQFNKTGNSINTFEGILKFASNQF